MVERKDEGLGRNREGAAVASEESEERAWSAGPTATAAGSRAADLDDSDEGGGDDGSEARDVERLAALEQRQIEREDREIEEARKDEISPVAGLLGPERWVQFAFIAIGLTTAYLADALITWAWQFVAEPDPTIASGSALILGILTAFGLSRHSPTRQFVDEVVGELSKVTWPTREETYYSTIVVIVTSVLAAVYTGIIDALWSAFTDLIYKV